MPILLNYKICDRARECGGIEVCPTGAIFWDETLQQPAIDNSKCTDCGLCLAACPVGAFVLATTANQFAQLRTKIDNDPRSETELWKERLGTQPGRTPPHAPIITPEAWQNEIVESSGLIAVDIWSEATLDCRYSSVPWEALGLDNVTLKKLDGGRYPELLTTLNITNLPTLIVFEDGKEIFRQVGYMRSGEAALARNFIRGKYP